MLGTGSLQTGNVAAAPAASVHTESSQDASASSSRFHRSSARLRAAVGVSSSKRLSATSGSVPLGVTAAKIKSSSRSLWATATSKLGEGSAGASSAGQGKSRSRPHSAASGCSHSTAIGGSSSAAEASGAQRNRGPVVDRLEPLGSGELHEDFRLWLTTEPVPTDADIGSEGVEGGSFPLAFLHCCVVVTTEPASGMLQGMRSSFQLAQQV